jgi:hypothetical protein
VTQKYTALKNLRYHAPGPRDRELILAGTPEAKGLTFEHLTSGQIKILELKGYIVKEPDKKPKGEAGN